MNRWLPAIFAVLILGSATVALSPSSAKAKGPDHSVAPLVGRPGGPQREIFGFVNAGNLGDPSVGYQSWNFGLLTTVAYFGLHVNAGDGHLVTYDTAWNVYHSSTMTNFVNTAHANGVRVIVSINMHDTSTDPNSQMCQSLIAANAQSTITQSIQQMQSAGIDGINVNYEGDIATCANGSTTRDQFTTFVQNLRSQMPAGSYLAVDTYAGSAEDNQEFFNVTGLAPSVDQFFVMSYDSDYSNSSEPPLNCSSYCFNPISPANTYRFNVSKTIAQYTALVPASKVIIGQPYYGRRGCVPDGQTAHSYPIPNTNFVTTTYLYASTINQQSGVTYLSYHRDPQEGYAEWDTWYDSDWHCVREQYFDDVWSLGAKYALINANNLAGVGLFTLDYGGGAPELWAQLATYFDCPVTINLAATQSITAFSFGLSAGRCSVGNFDVEVHDDTLNEGWFVLPSILAGGASSVNTGLEGFQGHTYTVRSRALSRAGVLSQWAYASTQISATAAKAHPWSGLYTLDGFGGLHPADSPQLDNAPYWSWTAARAVHALPGANAPQSGLVLDAWGGLHAYGGPAIQVAQAPYYPNLDVARDFVFLSNGSGGYELDAWGGIHPFSLGANPLPPQPAQYPYFPGRDVAKKITLLSDGSGGYVLDAYGGIHPWSVSGKPLPVSIAQYGYWPGQNIARDLWLAPGSTSTSASGYVLDAYGGFHAFWSQGTAAPATVAMYGYWPGQDIARGLWLMPGATPSTATGYVLDGYGGIHPFAVGGQPLPPAIGSYGYWPGRDIAIALWGA